MIKLNSEMFKLLRYCLIQENQMELLSIIESPELIDVDEKLGNELREIVLNVFLREGLEVDDEPNKFGFKLEDLIDKIGDMFL